MPSSTEFNRRKIQEYHTFVRLSGNVRCEFPLKPLRLLFILIAQLLAVVVGVEISPHFAFRVRRVYYIPVRHRLEMNRAQMGEVISVPPNCPVCLAGVSVNNRMDSYLV